VPVGNYSLQDFIDAFNTLLKAISVTYSADNTLDQQGKIKINTTSVLLTIKFDTMKSIFRAVNDVLIDTSTHVYTVPTNSSIILGVVQLQPV
jgi:hypothetical protein